MNNQGIINYPGPKQEYKVLVRCFTYNQKTYIEDALNGFAMQQTDFPFVCFVMDDASTDGEQNVIKAWMERECDINNAESFDISASIVIIVPHKVNINCTFVFYFLKQNLYKKQEEKIKHIVSWRKQCEYEAICEGDDYWIDPFKLQKQVDFMETHPEYVLSHTNFKTIPTKRINTFVPENNEDVYLRELLSHEYRIATQTVLFRRDTYELLPKRYQSKSFKMTDYPLWIEFARLGKFKYHKDCTSVYRLLEASASHSKDIQKEIEFYKSSYECSEYYIKEFKLDIPVKYTGFYVACMKSAFKHQDKNIAHDILHKALQHRCLSMKLLAFYIATIFPLAKFILRKIYNN